MICGLAGNVHLHNFANLRKLDMWQRFSDTESTDHKQAEWVWETSPVIPELADAPVPTGEFMILSPHVVQQLSALVNLEEIVSNPLNQHFFGVLHHMMHGK